MQFAASAQRSAKAVPKRSAVLYGQVCDREAQFRSRPARPVAPREDCRIRFAAAREAEGEAQPTGCWNVRFRNYFHKAERTKGPTGENLIIFLERRLDNVVWRAGLASSRSQARQLVLHGHVRINGKKVNIPSYQINVGEEIAIKEKMHQNAMIMEARNVAQSQNAVPWLEQDREQFKAKFVALPKRDDVQTPPINEQLIVELYSK